MPGQLIAVTPASVRKRQTTAVNMSREPHDIYIGRGSMFGNPYEIGAGMTREQSLECYLRHLEENPGIISEACKLKGLRLGCFCKPLACHGDILARIAERFHAIRKNNRLASIDIKTLLLP